MLSDEELNNAPEVKWAAACIDYFKNYMGAEAMGCPACTYDNGKFIKLCNMHKKLEIQAKEIERLTITKEMKFDR